MIFFNLRFNIPHNTLTFVQSKTILTNPKEILLRAKAAKNQIKQQCKQLSKINPRQLDTLFHTAHTDIFENFDCLQCANCCITTGPMLSYRDIERAASALRIRPSEFIEKYVKIDEDGDQVMNTLPCPFLGKDNLCIIYAARPKACREYPHTDRTNMYQILELSQKNARVCPAVFLILEEIAANLKK